MLPCLPMTRLLRIGLFGLMQCLLLAAFPAQSYAQSKSTPAKGTATHSGTNSDTATEKPAPYDGQLARLSEILGALQYIEVLCKISQPNDWHQDMSNLLAAEAGQEPKRQERLTASYNRGYRSFAALYTQCTDNAKAAETSYRHEAATLAQEITSRFGN